MTQNHVLTVISSPAKPMVSGALVTDLQKLLTKRRAGGVNPIVLAKGEAADIFFTSAEVESVVVEMKQYFRDKPLDWAVLPANYRKKRLLVSDMDSTMIGQECIDEIADFAGLKEKVAAITEAAMEGRLDFKQALAERVALLKGIEAGVLEQVYRERIVLTPGAATLIATMKANGARTILVSGGFTYFTSRVAGALGFDGEMANTLGIEDGRLTGRVTPPILDKQSKEVILRQSAGRLDVAMPLTMAVGDGANDRPMIEAAGLGVAWRAKEVLKQAADVAIDHGDLTALLYLQGYRKDEFVTPKAA